MSINPLYESDFRPSPKVPGIYAGCLRPSIGIGHHRVSAKQKLTMQPKMDPIPTGGRARGIVETNTGQDLTEALRATSKSALRKMLYEPNLPTEWERKIRKELKRRSR